MVSGPPSVVYQPPPQYPEPQEDPAVADAIRKQNAIERAQAGRGATILGGGTVSPLASTPTSRAGARMLGDFGKLGGGATTGTARAA
jgi:hypothetical protein